MDSIERLLLTEADIILLALRDGDKKISEIRPSTGLSLSSVYNNVRKLLEAGLISERRIGNPSIRMLSLTERGRRLAEVLFLLRSSLRGREERREYEIVPE